MDGTNRKTIINTDIKWPQYLAIDRTGQWLYWTDTIKATIEKCRYDGSERQTVITYNVNDTSLLLSLTLDKTYIYFSAIDRGKVQRVPLAGGAIEEIGVTSDDLTFARIYDMVAVSSALTVTGSNGCSFANGGCAQFCLPTPTGHTCACDEKFSLDPSGKDCLLASFQKVVIVADKDRSGIFVVDVPTGAYLRAHLFNVNEPTGITWDPIAGTFMWASRFYKRIGRSCIYPQSCVDLIALWPDHVHGLEGLTIDPFKKHLYLTDALNYNIFRVSYEGNMDAKDRTKTLIINLGISTPRGLAVDLTYRMLFWTEYSPIPRIRKAFMDGGSNIITVIDKDIKWPNDVVVDTERQLIYWCDGLKKTIETATTNGENRTVLYKGEDVILSLTLDEYYIMFSDSETGSLHRIDRWNGGNAYAFGPSFFLQPYDIIYVDKTLSVTPPPIRPLTLPVITTTMTPTSTTPSTTTPSIPTNGTNNGALAFLSKSFKDWQVILLTVFAGLIFLAVIIGIGCCIVCCKKKKPREDSNAQVQNVPQQQVQPQPQQQPQPIQELQVQPQLVRPLEPLPMNKPPLQNAPLPLKADAGYVTPLKAPLYEKQCQSNKVHTTKPDRPVSTGWAKFDEDPPKYSSTVENTELVDINEQEGFMKRSIKQYPDDPPIYPRH